MEEGDEQMKPCISIGGWLFGHHWQAYFYTGKRWVQTRGLICKRCGATLEDVKKNI